METNREEWLAARRTGIGGSDVAAIVGLSTNRDAMAVFNDKLGLSDDLNDDPNMAEMLEMGLLMEPIIAEKYERATGEKVTLNAKLARNPDLPEWVLGTPDGFVGDPIVWEAKNISFGARNWGKGDDVESVPMQYRAQVTWYMMITGRPMAHVCRMLFGYQFKFYEVPFDKEFADWLLAEADKFRTNHILTLIPPENAETSPEYDKYLAAKFPANTDVMIEPTAETRTAVETYDRAREQEKLWKEKKENAARILKKAVEDAQGIAFGDYKFTYKKTKDTAKTDWEGLSKAIGYTPEQLKQFTIMKVGHRVINVKAKE